ncbi:UDP-N-acetylmuramoyl-tripeptide--D-alanyl-D-alanine ligase [Candidatus Uhrbacteria bacterium]|nr:UDP-N-acetylmuramoyl-tripeptide--D-alanyl-D-alanine ligase [Candidatus Uhrbacteria bacterium]
MRHHFEQWVARLARGVIARQRPRIVGVTGSVGKTSTKEAIRAVLARTARIRSAPKNYNNEIGLPVTIIGGMAPGRSLSEWITLLLRGWWYRLFRSATYPEVLVLEYGADHPGDLAHLLRIARPHIGVVTAVGPAHTEFFGTLDRVIAEKRRLIEALPQDGVAILNADDANVLGMRAHTRARVWTYGFAESADVRGAEYQIAWQDHMPTGIALKILAEGSVVPVHLRGCIGMSHASAALAAATVGLASRQHLVAISHALEQYVPPPSRMALLPGIKRTILIDDSYNASPLAVTHALEVVRAMRTTGRQFVVLGDMLELGAHTDAEHARVGEQVAELRPDYFVVVGEAMRIAAARAQESGLPKDRVLTFRTAAEAGRYVQDLLTPGDVVLVKGSQGVRMERVVVELMAEPLRKAELVCRQDSAWEQR